MSPGGVKKMMHLDALSGELDGDMDGGMDSEMPSAEAGGETINRETPGDEVASALGVLTGAAKAVGDASNALVGAKGPLHVAGLCCKSCFNDCKQTLLGVSGPRWHLPEVEDLADASRAAFCTANSLCQAPNGSGNGHGTLVFFQASTSLLNSMLSEWQFSSVETMISALM